jgi:cation transport ATPase
MKRRGIQLSPRHKRWFHTVTALLFFSGAGWAVCGWLATAADENASAGSLKLWLLKLHGAAAMAFLVALGILIPTHIKRGWQARRNRANGAFFLTMVALLVATGYGLYYFGDEQWRSVASWVHQILGFASPVLLAWHIWQGRRAL